MTSIKAPSFYQGFQQSIKYPLTPTLGEWPRYIAYPLVYVLARYTAVRPDHVVVAGFLCSLCAALLVWLSPGLSSYAAILMLLYVVLDNADGQLARYTGRVTALGGLLDIVCDFVSLILLYLAIGLSQLRAGSEFWQTLFLVFCTFILHVFTATISSFYYQHIKNGNDIFEVSALKFISLPQSDKPSNRLYSKVFSVLIKVYSATWIAISRTLIRTSLLRRLKKSALMSHVMALGEIGSLGIVLSLFLLAQIPLSFYLLYVGALCLVLMALCQLGREQ